MPTLQHKLHPEANVSVDGPREMAGLGVSTEAASILPVDESARDRERARCVTQATETC